MLLTQTTSGLPVKERNLSYHLKCVSCFITLLLHVFLNYNNIPSNKVIYIDFNLLLKWGKYKPYIALPYFCFTSATFSGPPRSLISLSNVFGGKALLRMSTLSSNSFFMSLHCSAAELEGIAGLLADDIKVESAGALADWWSVLKWPVSKGNSSRETHSYLPLTPPPPPPHSTMCPYPRWSWYCLLCNFLRISLRQMRDNSQVAVKLNL